MKKGMLLNAFPAALLSVAEVLSKAEIQPKRSVVFMSVDGEEGREKLAAGYGYIVPGLMSFVKRANQSYVHRRIY